MNQGVLVRGIVMDSDLIYPVIKDICYVTWHERTDGIRYLHRIRGHPANDLRSIVIKKARCETLTQADVLHIKLVPMEEGIDPYIFLGLPKF